MLTEDQKAEMCQEVATCPAYLEKLDLYDRQALQHYVKGKQQYLASRPEEEQIYYRAAFPAYELADVVAALLDTPAEAEPPAAIAQPHTNAKPISSKPATSLRGLALEDVQELFQHPILQSEGDRAAALAILNSQNYLPGSAYDLDEWFATNVGAKVSRRLISASIKEIREEGELSKKAQQAAEWVAQWLQAKAKR